MVEERLKVLELVANGKISAGEGEQLLTILEAGSEVGAISYPDPEPAYRSIQVEDDLPAKSKWQRYWPYPILAGGVLISSGLWYTILVAESVISWGWLFMVWFLLTLGVLLLLLGWLMRSQNWLHLRIKDGDTNLNFSLPFRLSWIVGGIRVARRFIPHLSDYVTDDIIEALANTPLETGFQVEVQETKGEQVHIYYG